jgi:hypothetical protein
MKRTILILALALAGCGAPIQRTHVETVKVPVAQPCAGQRPAKVSSLKARTPDWDKMDVRQKAAAVGAWGLDQQTYAEHLDAATAGCP